MSKEQQDETHTNGADGIQQEADGEAEAGCVRVRFSAASVISLRALASERIQIRISAPIKPYGS